MITTQKFVERVLPLFAERVAVEDGERSLSYRALRERSGRLGNALLGLGASLARPVAILLPNRVECVEVDLACMRAGVTRVAIGTRLSPDECRYILNHSNASVLVTTESLYEKIADASIGGLQVLCVGDGSASYEGALARAAAGLNAAAVSAADPAYILYTSGTTGRPKGATHSQGGRMAAMLNMVASELDIDRNSAMVHCGPLSHGSGSKVLSFLAVGARNILMEKFDPGELGRIVETRGGSHTFLVPTMLQMILESERHAVGQVRGMRQISFGGAPITNNLFGKCVEQLGPILTQVYGTSEAPHPITLVTPDDYAGLDDPSVLAESAGRPALASDIQVRDEQGRLLPPGEEGELFVAGEHLMSGYWDNPEATAEVFPEPGWYATGDVGVIDDRGFLSLRDRKRDLIISGGLNVYPSEVERVLDSYEGISEVAVVGAPSERWGEIVTACIVPSAAGEFCEDALMAWLDDKIAGYKKPRQIKILAELPKGATNKVLKRELRRQFWPEEGRQVN